MRWFSYPLLVSRDAHFRLRPRRANKAAMISATPTIKETVLRAEEAGKPGIGVGVAGMGVAVLVWVNVGQAVIVGR